MYATRYATLGVEADVVLHGAKVGQTERTHFRPLPVFFEPATRIAVNRQVKHQKPRNVSGLHAEFFFVFQRHENPFY